MTPRISFEEGDSRDRLSTELSCNNWSDASWVLYLNLINCDSKTWGRWIPWGSIPTLEKSVLRFCKREIYSHYKSKAVKRLWTCRAEELPDRLRKLLQVFKVLGDSSNDGAGLYTSLISVLTTRNRTDLLPDVWNCVCRSEEAKIAVFEAEVTEGILCVAREAGFDFWGVWSGRPTIQHCPVTDALLNGKVEQLTILLRNGFQQNDQRLHTYDKVFQASINPRYHFFRAPLADPSTPRPRKIVTESLLFMFLLSSTFSQRRRRTLLQCHDLLWAVLPEAPPTTAEPRPLLHLCKCAVRAALGMGLPGAAQSLPLPARLRDYIADVTPT